MACYTFVPRIRDEEDAHLLSKDDARRIQAAEVEVLQKTPCHMQQGPNNKCKISEISLVGMKTILTTVKGKWGGGIAM